MSSQLSKIAGVPQIPNFPEPGLRAKPVPLKSGGKTQGD